MALAVLHRLDDEGDAVALEGTDTVLQYSSGTRDMTRLSFFQCIFNNGCVLFFLRTHPLDQRDIDYSLRLNSQYQSNDWGRI